MSILFAMKWSLGAFAITLILGLMSMGALGAALYYLCYPALAPFYGNLNNWHGDWVWSATIWTGTLWSMSFLCAGLLNMQLKKQGTSTVWRRGAYVAVLWIGALAIWALVLLMYYVPAKVADKDWIATLTSPSRSIEEQIS